MFAAAFCNRAQALESAAAPSRLDTLVVTGHPGSPRAQVDSLAPVDVLTADELRNTGAASLTVALRTLLPSLNFPEPSLAGPTDGNLPAQLRGLAPDQVLVLIDGKRRHTTAMLNDVGERVLGFGTSPVDLAAIPMNAIARVEVLRDGAAAQYGSDAIAGVINLILKKGAGHGSAQLGHGIHDQGDGSTWRAGADTGLALGADGWLRASVNALDQQPTNRSGPDIRYPDDPTYGEYTIHYGKPRLRSQQAGLNLGLDFSEAFSWYATGLFNRRDVRSAGFFRSLSEYAEAWPATVQVYPSGYLPTAELLSHDHSLATGVRGSRGELDYDISLQTGGNHFKRHGSQTINHSLGLASPARFYVGTLSNRQDLFDASFVSRAHPGSLPNPLVIAWGVQARREQFTLKPGETASWIGTGADGSQGFMPDDAGTHARSNQAVHVDLSTDFSERLGSAIALRQEHYSDFGNNFSWKASSRFAFTDALALRATVATGFRAPSLQQSFYSSTSVNYINTGQGPAVLFAIRTFPGDDPAAVALGAQALLPEKSASYNLGFVLGSDGGLYATLDFYQIDIDDTILLSGNLVGEAVTDYLGSVGIEHVAGGRFFTNAADTRTRGADLVLTRDWSLATAGTLKLVTGLSYNRTSIRAIKPNPPQLGLAGLTLPVLGREARGRITGVTPRTKGSIALTWERDNWQLDARLSHYGRFHYLGVIDTYDQDYAARQLLDLSISRRLGNWRLTLGADNLTNTYPDKNNELNAYYGIGPDPMNSPFGFSGVHYYTTVAADW